MSALRQSNEAKAGTCLPELSGHTAPASNSTEIADEA
jgi:hypothetical protein